MAQNGQDWKERFQEWHARHGSAHYTPIFNAALEALMDDDTQCAECRVLAYLQRYAWGNHSDFAVIDGRPAWQKDIAARLGLHKQQVSSAISLLESQNYVDCQGRLLYLVANPSSRQAKEKRTKVTRSSDFQEFLDWWKVTRSSDFETLEVLRSEIERLRGVQRSDYKQWLASRTNGGTLNNEVEQKNSYSEASSSSSFQEKAVSSESTAHGERAVLLESTDNAERTNPTTTTSHTNDHPPKPQIPLKAESVEPVVEALALYGTPDADAVQSLIHDCREQDPECTVEEIAAAVRQKGAQGVRMRNAIGFLITSVPKVFFSRPTPSPPPVPAVSPGGVCTHCSGSGFVGRIWTTWPEARMLFRAGVPFCECEAGEENEREMRAEAVATMSANH